MLVCSSINRCALAGSEVKSAAATENSVAWFSLPRMSFAGSVILQICNMAYSISTFVKITEENGCGARYHVFVGLIGRFVQRPPVHINRADVHSVVGEYRHIILG